MVGWSTPDPEAAQVAFLSLLTLSVAVMAYFFFYQPLQLFVDGKKKEALRYFSQTVGIFGVLTVIIWVLLLVKML